MSEQGIVGRADLQKKDKGELQAIVAALGGKSTSRDRKADLIDKVLELSGVIPAASATERTAAQPPQAAPPAQAEPSQAAPKPAPAVTSSVPATTESALPFESGASEAAPSAPPSSTVATGDRPAPRAAEPTPDSPPTQPQSGSAVSSTASPAPSPGSRQRGEAKPDNSNSDQASKRGRNRRGRGGEPPAEWETDLSDGSGKPAKGEVKNSDGHRSDGQRGDAPKGDGSKKAKNDGSKNSKGDGSKNQSSQKKPDGSQGGSQNVSPSNGGQQNGSQGNSSQGNGGQNHDDDDGGNRRRRRRGRNRDRDDEVANLEPVAVSGFMELRDDGYGFLRVNGWMPSKEDVYVPVRMVRQCGLRKGDHIVGTARPANRNEKNPAMENIESINGLSPTQAKGRPFFDDLTPLYPTERLRLERTSDSPVSSRIIDLIAPIGKGQRGLIVSPPKSGKTSLIKDIAGSIEANNPEAHLVVLLIDERPEEVTEIERSLDHAEVVASTFDRPAEEHCALAELTIERAKRMVEAGEDVVIVLDGLTRLVRAYNSGGPSVGRQLKGGVDAAAIYPPKRFFGSARNLDEGGSLTILASLSIETSSDLDQTVFEEFANTANLEIHLDRDLAESGVFPAINVDATATRRPELVVETSEATQLASLRTVLDGVRDKGRSAQIDLLVDKLSAAPTNAKFLSQITSK